MLEPNIRIGGRMREPFDRNREFVVIRTLRVSGKLCEGGSILDKTLVTTRRLQQMYDNRLIKLAAQQDVKLVETPSIPVKPDFNSLSNEGLRQWLKNNKAKTIVSPRWSHATLVRLAENHWQEITYALTTPNRNSEASGERIQRPANDRHSAT